MLAGFTTLSCAGFVPSASCAPLVIEMTAGFPMLLPMLAACFTAMPVPTLPGDPPVYDALRER
jgi:CIC family chloride channel protein